MERFHKNEPVEWVIEFQKEGKKSGVMLYIPDPLEKTDPLKFIKKLKEKKGPLTGDFNPSLDDLMDLIDQFLDIIKKFNLEKKDDPNKN